MRSIENKRAQIGETMTWVVATLIILAVIIISVVITSTVFSGKEKNFESYDEEKDYVATKSVLNFLSNEKNLELIKKTAESGDEDALKKSIEPLLKSMRWEIPGKEYAWNFRMEYKSKEYEIINLGLASQNIDNIDTNTLSFSIPYNGEIIKLEFWERCSKGCLR